MRVYRHVRHSEKRSWEGNPSPYPPQEKRQKSTILIYIFEERYYKFIHNYVNLSPLIYFKENKIYQTLLYIIIK